MATDVASRGIDISDLTHVINYALPERCRTVYLHRTGRTGRIGKKGVAVSLVGGPDIGTRKTLVHKHGIEFTERTFPDPEEAVAKRVGRQAKRIKEGMGHLAFEAYVPTAKALMERKDGPMLIAAALRTFFQWDRQRRLGVDDLSSIDEIKEARADKDSKRGRGRGRDDDRRSSRDDDRGGKRGRGRGRKGSRDSDDSPKGERKGRSKKSAPKDEGLDDLFSVEGDSKPAKKAKGGKPRADKKPKADKKSKGGKKPKADAPSMDDLFDVG